MKKIILILLSLITISCSSQIIPGAVSGSDQHRGEGQKVYVSIPSGPTFSDSHTLINATTGDAIQSGDTGGKTQLVVGGDYPKLQLNGLTGTYYIKGTGTSDPATWPEIGGLTNDYSLSTAASVPNVFYYNLRLKDSDNVIKFSADSPGKTQYYRTIFVRNAAFGAFIPNESVSGKEYGNLTISFCSSKNSGGEALCYCGHTGTSLTDYVGIDSLYHSFSDSAGREGIQMNNHAHIEVFNNTAINSGQDIANSGIGQALCAQFQGIGTGSVHHNILTSKGPLMIASTGLHIHHNFIGWTQTDRESYIQDISANGYHFEMAGDTLIIEDNIFYCPGYTLAWVFRLQEENCHVIIRNNIFPASATDVIKDERSSTPYSLTITGNTFTDSPPVPTLVNHPDSRYSNYFKVVIDSYFYHLRMGALTP